MLQPGRFLLALMVAGLGLGRPSQELTITFLHLAKFVDLKWCRDIGEEFFHALKGIHYGESPIGDLRFRVNYNQISETCLYSFLFQICDINTGSCATREISIQYYYD